ncbi:MAG: FimV/HubP family polar landmark protein, partial [Steroidobacteraceae bacterium]
MSLTKPRVLILAGLLSLSSLWSNSSFALGLGEIHLNSALNEPMSAEIDLIAASPEELSALRATLAPRDAFTRYGIDRPPFLSTLTFKVAKSKDGRDVLQVRSTDAIPEPFVTFLVEVNWARGRLMREYTVLLDPPVYTPGENASSSAPVTAPTTAATPPAAAMPRAAATPSVSAPSAAPPPAASPPTAQGHRRSRPGTSAPASSAAESSVAAAPSPATSAAPAAEVAGAPGTVQVVKGDTLTKIARSLHADTRATIDQTMIALYRSNPEAFGGNINILRQGAVLRVPGADQIAAQNEKEAIGEVHRQLDAWRTAGGAAAAPSGRLRLVTPTAGGSGTESSKPASPAAGSTAGNGETQALKDRVKDLEGQLAESKRVIDIRNQELSELQRKLAAAATPPAPQTAATQPKTPAPPPAATPQVPPPVAQPPAAQPPAAATAPPPPAVNPLPQPEPNIVAPVPPPKPAVNKPATPPAAASGSWLDWVQENYLLLGAVLALILAALGFVAWRRRKQSSSAGSLNDLGSVLDETQISDMRDSAAKLTAMRKGNNDSFVVEESGPHAVPDFTAETGRFGDTGELKPASPEDTMSSESAVNLDQGDPLAEADFHMAYGLYDQAADLVRIALEREPDRRDLRLKLLEIYFVWGNKDAFLQTAKELAASRELAPAGEWDKIVIMGKQICPDEPMFASSSAGSGRGAGAL